MARTLVLAVAAGCGPPEAPGPPVEAIPAWSPVAVVPAGAFTSPRHRVEDLAAGPGGTLHAVFTDTRGPVSRWNRVLYARFDGRAWSPPEPVDDTPGRSHAPRVAVDGAGRAHVFWWEGMNTARPGHGTHLLHRARGGEGWSAPDTVYREPAPSGLMDLQLAAVADAAGRVHVVHSRAEGRLGYAVREGEAWRAGAQAPAGGGYLRWDRPAARAGRLELAYVAAQVSEARRSANNDLWTLAQGADGWRAPAPVHLAPTQTLDPAVVTDGQGVRHAVWTERTARGRVERLLHSTSRDGVRWEVPRDVVPPSPDADFYAPRLELDAQGRVNLLFLRSTAASVVPFHARGDGRGGWSTPRRVAPDEPSGRLDLELAADAGGTLHALWRGVDGLYRHARLPG
ncbi:MAG: hypothetical protein KY467_08590 [Gemmatimonadetes bacterium]|nr:hypothetical protein [Gemmatimonadota bacterium]